jgi:PAS domain S-box-containing protein
MTAPPPLDTGELYRVLAETSSDAIVTIDEQSVVLSVNPAGERLFGYPASELIGHPLSRVMPERLRARHGAGVARYVATGVRHIPWQAIRVPILTRDAREVPVEISFGEFESGGRRVFSAILRDISERVAAEEVIATTTEQLQQQAVELEHQVIEAQAMGEELEQTNEELYSANAALDAARAEAEQAADRLREVLESLADAVSVFDREWRWTYVNPSAARVLVALGRDPSAVIGEVLWEQLPQLLGTPFEVETRRAAESGKSVSYTEWLPGLDRWFEIRIVPSSGGLTTFTRDVTEQYEAAELRRSQEAEYRALANSIPTLAWMANPDGAIVWYNDRWYEYTGTAAEEMEGWGWQRVHHPEWLAEVTERWTHSIRTGELFEMTFPLRAADGTFRPFLTRVFPLRDESGAVVRWFGTNTDVQHEHAAREAAELATARTRQLLNLTALLARARTLDDVAAAVVTEATQSTGAVSGMLTLRDGDTDEAMMLGQTGMPRALSDTYLRFPLTRDTPSAECIRTGVPIFIGQREGPDGLLERYPSLRAVWDTVGRSALACVPLLVNERAIGAMSFTFAEPRVFSDDDRDFLLTLAAQGTQAIQRVRAFDAERLERHRSESIVESITDGFVTFDRDMRFTYVNAQAAAMFGMSRDELVGRDINTMRHGGASPFTKLIRAVIDERSAGAVEGYGTITGRWLDMRAYPADDGGATAYFQDITTRRRQQEASSFLAEASRMLAASPDYEETLVNLARASIPRLGDWCAIDLVQHDGDDAGPRLVRAALVHEDAGLLAMAEEYRRLYPPTVRGSGSAAQALEGRSMLVPVITDDMLVAGIPDPRQLELTRALGLRSMMVVPLVSGSAVLGVMTCVTGESGRHFDESDLRLAEDLAGRAATAVERARLLEEAESANAAKTEFLRTVSHELRQPLNAIGGLLQLWELGLRGPVSAEQQLDIERIKRNQRRLTSLIEDLLSFARLEAGKLEVQQHVVQVNAVFESLTSAMAIDLETRSLDYRCELADPTLAVLGDGDRLHQVLVNLVTNAMKATAAGGRIDVWAAAEGGTVELHVKDTGVGIPAEMLDAVFTPFVQVGRALNQPREGAGLGLAISRGLVEAMGGRLTAQSTLGSGSTFTVSLTAAHADGEDRTAG